MGCGMNLRPGIDPEEVEEILTGFVASYVEDAGADGVVVGLSGGVDSAVTCALCVRALGADQVHAILMPSETTPAADMEDARELVDQLGCPSETVPVDGIVDAVADSCDHGTDAETMGNVAARARMIVLYRHANAHDRLVVGTGNKSELLTGYFTKHGDGAADILPLGDLYKTQVRRLAEHLDVPEPIRDKPPSAGLVEGQTDEDDLGLAYDGLDRVLRGLELGYDAEEIADVTGLDAERVEHVRRMERRSRHKRVPATVAKIGARTSGVDWREKTV